MAELAEAPMAIELTPDEVERISTRLRRKINAENLRGKQQQWILIGVESKREAEVIHATAKMAGRIISQHRREITERNIEALVRIYLQGEPRAEIDRKLELDNAELRARYLREVPTCTAAEIHEFPHGLRPSNPSEPASRWKRERRVFAVSDGRSLRYPLFQFADGSPRPVIKNVLMRLPEWMTHWQIAFWFRSGNGWLDGRSPEEALEDEGNVLNAADRLCEPTIG